MFLQTSLDLAQSSEQAGCALPWAPLLKGPHMETSWHRTETGLSKCFPTLAYFRPCAHDGHSYTAAFSWLRGARGGGVTSRNAPCVSSRLCSLLFHLGIPLPALIAVYDRDTASMLLLLSWWSSHRVSGKVLDLQEPMLWGNALPKPYSCLFQPEPRTPCRGEGKLAWYPSVGLAIGLGRAKNVTAHLARIY